MLILVLIDLSGADLPLFEAYERRVLALLDRYGGRIEERLRGIDERSEAHLLHFPDADAFAAFRSDPLRTALLGDWERCGATSTLVEVTRL